ncbi:MAG TPA: hypothetical protein VGE24_12965 [Emticicia sp.]
MENQNNSEAIIGNEQTKLDWNTPEVEVFSVKDTTLAGGPGATDSGFLS